MLHRRKGGEVEYISSSVSDANSSPTNLPFSSQVPPLVLPIPYTPPAPTPSVSLPFDPFHTPYSSPSSSSATPRKTENQNEILPTSSTPPLSSSTKTPLSSPTTSTATPITATIIFTSNPTSDSGNAWHDMASGAHTGVIMSIVVGIFFVIFFSFWFCCGGRAWWSKRNSHSQTHNNGMLPLHNRNAVVGRGVNRESRGADAPPQYEEVAPPSHQRLAGGMHIPGMGGVVGMREEEEGVVADGKMPVSEMVLEDVVLDRDSQSERSDGGSESRRFGEMHHGLNGLGGGDTRGHTNT